MRDTMFNYLKFGHMGRNCKNKTPTQAPSNGSDEPKGKKTWIEIENDRSSRFDDIVITQSYGSSDHTTSH